MLYYMRRVTL